MVMLVTCDHLMEFSDLHRKTAFPAQGCDHTVTSSHLPVAAYAVHDRCPLTLRHFRTSQIALVGVQAELGMAAFLLHTTTSTVEAKRDTKLRYHTVLQLFIGIDEGLRPSMMQLDASRLSDLDTLASNMSSDLTPHTSQGHRGITTDDGWNVASAIAPGRGTTSPVGLKGAAVDDPQSQGEALRSMGALSAPPPPGFNTGSGERSRSLADEFLFASSARPGDIGGGGRGSGGASAGTGGGDNNGFTTLNRGGSGRTNSFSNLAAALGTGLAESMDDATKGELKGGALLTDNFFLDSKTDLSYARHSRHLATRLLGTSPSKDAFGPSHTAPEAGSLFASLNSGVRNFPKKSASGSQSPLLGNIVKQQKGDTSSSGLMAAFSNDNSDDRLGDLGSSFPVRSTGHGDYGTDARSRLSTTKDLGVTVMEPSDSSGRGAGGSSLGGLLSSQRTDGGTFELERGMQNLWSEGEKDVGRSGHSAGAGNSSLISTEDQMSPEEALRPFMWDVRHKEPSRTLVILNASAIPANDVRATCDMFGVVDGFRPDFSDRGIFFVSFFDLRAAQYAALELQSQLQRLNDRSGGDRVVVQFCIPLNASSQNDESLVVLTDVPLEMDLEGLASMLSSFGAVRSLKSLGGSYSGSSYVVEYHDVQDAKQAILELESMQPWGPDVSIEAGPRNPADRKRGRELLALIGRWRQGRSPHRRTPDRGGMIHQSHSRSPPHGAYPSGSHLSRNDPRYDRVDGSGRTEQSTQLVLGPDGRYSYVVVNHSPHYPPSSYGANQSHHHMDGPHQRLVHNSRGTYVTHVHQPGQSSQFWSPQSTGSHHQQTFPSGGSVVSASSFPDGQHVGRHYPSGSQSVPGPYYGHHDDKSTGSHSHMMSMPPPSTSSTTDERDNRHLMLDLDAVENGRDSRTSLMVRNIPNKYTQQMLLSEFTEHGHGPGIIDFFYLPIDFKNRCNRGYAFINFVDYRDILPFHRRYYGKHWRTFNSDKICDITYARIQGKSAMLKRFENSALMEKDDEYKPLVFVSHGPDKGTRLPFPDLSNKP